MKEQEENNKEAEDIVKFQWADYKYTTTKAGRDLILQVLNPDKNRLYNETQDIIIDYKEGKDATIFLKEVRPEDCLEYLYEISDKWKEFENPVESIKTDLRQMIRALKEEKFNRMQRYLKVFS